MVSRRTRVAFWIFRRDHPSRPNYDLLFLLVLQDIRHVARGYLPSRRCQCPGRFF